MSKLTIIDTVTGDHLGEVDREGFSWSGHNAVLCDRAANQLRPMLGQGYGDREFNLVDDDGRVTLEGCHIVRDGGPGGGCGILFLRATRG